jgi:ABC-type transport system involved in multi-copper enzyme maturation permease subunit
MSDGLLPAPPPGTAAPLPAGRFGGLVRAEVQRFTARRFIRVLLALAVLGMFAVLAITLTQFGSTTPERLAEARDRVQETVAVQEGFRQQCLADPSRPADVDPDAYCGAPLQAADLRVEDFLDPQPFPMAAAGPNGAVAFSAAAAVLAFLLGATFVGAEWSSRSIVALLFWETRRTRVMAAKLLVVAAAGLLLGGLAQLAWLGIAGLLQAVAGDGAPLPDGFWPELLALQGRGVLLAVLAGLLGFGLTNLVRNTGATLGLGFVYFAVVETAVRVVRPTWQPWLLTNTAAGLVLPGGVPLYTYVQRVDAQGNLGSESVEYLLGNLQAGSYLLAVTAVITVVGIVLFARRDLH